MKILFLGNGSNYSLQAEKIVKEMNCEVIDIHNDKKRFNNFDKMYEIGISFLYPFIVPSEEINKAIWINFHPAPLPEFCGRNVAYHAIMSNAKKYGATIHYMDENFDTGDIIKVNYFSIKESDTAYDIFNKSCKILLDLLKKYLAILINKGDITTVETKQRNNTFYNLSNIDDYIHLEAEIKKEILAKTFPPYYPKIMIGKKTFIIMPEIISN